MTAGDRTVEAGRRNLLLLVQLRWLAVAGQLATILIVHVGIGVRLPLVPMLLTLAALVLLNLGQLAARDRPVTNGQLLAALLIDVAALSVQLYLSGGATNPFVTLFLLQVVLGAVLLAAWSGWLLVAVTSAAFALLAAVHVPLLLPSAYASRLSVPYVIGSWFNFTLAAVLLVLFVTRIAANLRARDAHLASMRQRAAEEEHIVRMGLLASGAAHELGTPLASVSVALGDWAGEPAIRADPRLADEVAEMRAEIARCKTILSGILQAAGEVSGEAPARTTLARFLRQIVARWDAQHPGIAVLDDAGAGDPAIVADGALGQAIASLLDNALEAGARRISVIARCSEGRLRVTVADDGPGFAAGILADIGKPYRSTKPRDGAGLGLFLASNTMRTLGGTLDAANGKGGAAVTLDLPLAALALPA